MPALTAHRCRILGRFLIPESQRAFQAVADSRRSETALKNAGCRRGLWILDRGVRVVLRPTRPKKFNSLVMEFSHTAIQPLITCGFSSSSRYQSPHAVSGNKTSSHKNQCKNRTEHCCATSSARMRGLQTCAEEKSTARQRHFLFGRLPRDLFVDRNRSRSASLGYLPPRQFMDCEKGGFTSRLPHGRISARRTFAPMSPMRVGNAAVRR
jgi:hypothetical protein